MTGQSPEATTALIARWRHKFACAFRGLVVGVRNQNSFAVHIPMTLAVVGLATWLAVSPLEWAILILCITIVCSAELFNSAIEHLAKAITEEQHPEIRNALDVASGAVLMASMGAAVVGLMIFAWPLVAWFGAR